MRGFSIRKRIVVIDAEGLFFERLTRAYENVPMVTIEHIETIEEARNTIEAEVFDVYFVETSLSDEIFEGNPPICSSEEDAHGIIVFSSEMEDSDSIDCSNGVIAVDSLSDDELRSLCHSVMSFHFRTADSQEISTKFKTMMDLLSVVNYTVEPCEPFRLISISDSFKDYGIDQKRLHEDPQFWFELLHPDDRARVIAVISLARKSGEPISIEYRICLPEGKEIWFYDRAQQIYDAEGRPICWQGILIDVTEKKSTETELIASEGRFRDLFENANDLVYVHDLEGNFLSINGMCESIFGYTHAEALKLNLADILESSQLEIARKNIEEKLAGRIVPVYEIECNTRDGRTLILEINSRIIYDNGKAIAVQGNARDISDKLSAMRALIESEQRYSKLVENANDIIYTLDLDFRFTSINKAGKLMTGYTDEDVFERRILDLVAPEDLEISQEMIKRKLEHGGSTTFEVRIVTKAGERITVEVNSWLMIENGVPVGIQGIARNLTERNRLIEERNRFFRHSLDLLATIDEEHRFIQTNPSWKRILGYNEEELIGRDTIELVHEDDHHLLNEFRRKAIDGESCSLEARVRAKSGEYRWIYWGVVPIMNERVAYAFGRDITHRKESEDKLQHIALHDTLTNLPNRTLFLKHLEDAIAKRIRNSKSEFAVLFLDLDRFKLVNDSLGHTVGDKLLIAIAERIKNAVRPQDVIARLGGDEFTLLLSIEDPSEATTIAERLQTNLSTPFKIEGYEVFTTASIGIIISDDTFRIAEDYLRDADTAMYRAKDAGKARFEIFDSEMHIKNMTLLKVETDLRRALERNEFCVNYQPIVDLETGQVSEFEALLRWHHPEYGIVSPNEFISIAEETGLIVPIGAWILEEACRQTCEWQERFQRELSISVNLSTKQLMNPNLVQQVAGILVNTGLDRKNLKIEVTESSIIDYSDTAFSILSDLKNLGISLSTDDFGTGYSSLSYLHKYPFSRIKIDRSFINQVEDEKTAAIIRTILILGETLCIEVVAEGIETELQHNKLLRMGCRTGQGYYYSRPVPASEIEEMLETRNRIERSVSNALGVINLEKLQ